MTRDNDLTGIPASLRVGDRTYVRAGDGYTLGPGGARFVPTGRVFVRLREGAGARACAERFAALGMEIADVPSFAPHAAWLAHASGRPAAALCLLEEIAAVEGVVHVEPELVGEAERKESR